MNSETDLKHSTFKLCICLPVVLQNCKSIMEGCIIYLYLQHIYHTVQYIMNLPIVFLYILNNFICTLCCSLICFFIYFFDINMINFHVFRFFLTSFSLNDLNIFFFDACIVTIWYPLIYLVLLLTIQGVEHFTTYMYI